MTRHHYEPRLWTSTELEDETDVLMFLMHFHRPKDKKLIFNFLSVLIVTALKDMRQIFHQWFLVVGIVFNDTSFCLRYAHVYIQYFRLLRPSPLWPGGTSFASHAMGLRLAGWDHAFSCCCFFSCGSDCGLVRPFKIEFWSVIQEIPNHYLLLTRECKFQVFRVFCKYIKIEWSLGNIFLT